MPMLAMAPGRLERVTNGSPMERPYTSHDVVLTLMVARGSGFSVPMSLVATAFTTAFSGEK